MEGGNAVIDSRGNDAFERRPLHFEDVLIGSEFRSAVGTVDRAEAMDFAGRWDPQRFHLDEEAARNSLFRTLSLSGLNTLCLCFRLYNDIGLFRETALAGAGIEQLRWHRPAYPGDCLNVVVRMLDKRPVTRPDRGLVTVELSAFNQDHALVMVARILVLISRKSAIEDHDERYVRIEEAIEIERDIATVWDVIADFQRLDRWIATATMITDRQPQSMLHRHFAIGGSYFHERLDLLDGDAHRLRYSLLESPLPVDNYRAEVRVSATSEYRASVVWSTSCNAVQIDQQKCERIVRNAARSSLAQLKSFVEHLLPGRPLGKAVSKN